MLRMIPGRTRTWRLPAGLVQRRYRTKLEAGRKDLVTAALLRRGFAYPVVREALRRAEEAQTPPV